MAIEILTEPQDPVVSGDWTNLLKISQAGEVPELSLLTGWEFVGAVPAAKQGAFIRHAANTYQIKDSNYTILGSTATGINYIIASASGGVMTLTWSQDITGFSYDATNKGIYDSGGDQVIRDVLYIDGTDYIRGYASGMGFEIIQLADSSMYSTTLTIRGNGTFEGTVTAEKFTPGDTVFSDSRSSGSTAVPNLSTVTIPAGIYDWVSPNDYVRAEVNIGGTWYGLFSQGTSSKNGHFISDGVNYRWYSSYSGGAGAQSVLWIKHT